MILAVSTQGGNARVQRKTTRIAAKSMSVEWHFLITLTERLRPLKDPVEIQEVAVRLIESISTPVA